MKTKYFIKAKEFSGFPTLDNFKLIEENVDENLQDGGKHDLTFFLFSL